MVTLPQITTAMALTQRSMAEPYAPYLAKCDTHTLLRPAASLSENEAAYITRRKHLADQALMTWLEKIWGSRASVPACKLPTLALAMSGGGPKAGLLAAGVIQGLDIRDTSYPASGLLQSMTYISALSGGSLTLAGTMGNNFAQISTLRRTLYDTSYQHLGALVLENNVTVVRNAI